MSMALEEAPSVEIEEIETLSPSEEIELETCEAVIARGFQTVEQVGKALLQVRDRRLYRAKHGTFEDYLDARWGLRRSSGYQAIAAAGVIGNVSAIADIAPKNEAQTRPLQALSEGVQQEVWAAVVATTPEAQITKARVQQVVDLIKSPLPAGGRRARWTAEDDQGPREGWIAEERNGLYLVRPDDGRGQGLVCLAVDRPGLEVSEPAAAPVSPPAALEDAEGAQRGSKQDRVTEVVSILPRGQRPEPTQPQTAPTAAATPAAPEPTKPNALKSAEEIVAERAGTAVPTTIGAAVLDGPVTMCMVLEDCVTWLRADEFNAKSFLARVKGAAYHRGQSAAELLASLEG